MNIRRVACIAIIVVFAGCASRTKLPNWPAAEHVIAVNEKGETVDPTAWPKVMPVEAFDDQLDDLFAAMQRYHADRHAQFPDEPNRVMVFVHGGLTSPRDALVYASRKMGEIEKAGYYPIFIVWNADLGSSYGEHLVNVRQGRYETHSAWLAPFYLLADLGRAAARFPITWTFQAVNDFSRVAAAISSVQHHDAERRWLDNPRFAPAILVTNELVRRYENDPQHEIAISLGRASGNPAEAADYVGTYFLSLPLKFLCSPVLDGTGTAAWDNMYRRANILFDGFSAADLKFSADDAPRVLDPGDGALVKLMRRLKALNTRDAKCEIDLVGHSMGSIVLNELVRRSTAENVHYDNIVYMAAACSVRDFQRSVVPYLQRHRDCGFYNLCLHPVNELRERHAADLVPRGSLLVWLDDMFSNPHTPLDRTLGRWENVVPASYVIPREQRPQIHLKGFPCLLTKPNPPELARNVPQMHGDFSAMPYWDKSFWQPETPEVATQTNAPVRAKSSQIRQQQEQSQSRRRPTTRVTTRRASTTQSTVR